MAGAVSANDGAADEPLTDGTDVASTEEPTPASEGDGAASTDTSTVTVTSYEDLIANLSKTGEEAPATITLGADISATAQITVTRSVTIEGGYHTITAAPEGGVWSTVGGKKHLLLITNNTAGNFFPKVTLNDITLDSKGAAHGLQSFSKDASVPTNQTVLKNLVLTGSIGNGLYVNGGNVSATNMTVQNSVWQSVDIGPNSGGATAFTMDTTSQLKDAVQINSDFPGKTVSLNLPDGYDDYSFYYDEESTYKLQKLVWSNAEGLSAAVDKIAEARETAFNVTVANTTATDPLAYHANVTKAFSSYVADSSTVTQLKDVTITEPITIAKNVTFDGNNKKIVLNTPVGGTALTFSSTNSNILKNLDVTAAEGAKFGTAISLQKGANSQLINSKIDLTNLNSEHATSGKPMSSIAVLLSGKDAVVKGNTITAGNSEGSSSQCIVVGANATISDNILTTGTSKADPKEDGSTSSGSVAIRLSAANVIAEIINNTITSNKDSSTSTRNVAFAVDGSLVGGTVVNASNNIITLASHTLNGDVGGYGVVLYLNTGTSAEVVTNMHSNSVTGSTYVIYADNSSAGTSTTVKGEIFNNKFDITQNAVANHSTVTLTSSDLTWNTTPTTEFGTRKPIVTGQTYLAGNWWGTWSEGKKSTTGYLTFTDAAAAKAAGLPVADLAPLVTVGQSASTIEVTGNFSIENKTGKSETLAAQFTGGVSADFTWATTQTDIIGLSTTTGSSIAYTPVKVGTATVTVSSGAVTKTVTITVYDEVKEPVLPVSGVTKDEEGKTTISNSSEVEISDKTATIKEDNGVTMEVVFDKAPETGAGSIAGNVTSAKVTYPEKIAALSPDVATADTEIKTSYGLVIGLGNVTNQLPTIDPVFNTSVVDAIKAGSADAQSGKYTFISMITATSNVEAINKNVTSGGVAVTFTIPLDWANQIAGNQLGKLKAFHLKSDGTVIMLNGGTGVKDEEKNTYTFTVKGDGFSSYTLAAYTYTAPPTQVPTSGSSSSGGGNTDGALRVLFVTDGGSSGTVVAGLSSGDKVSQPATPVRNGYTFGGWYSDAACTKAWSFSNSINGDMTLYAKWASNGSGTVETYPATANPTETATVKQTSSSSGGANPTGTAAATTAQSGGVSPTMTKAPAPVFGILAGLLAAGVLLRRRE